MSIPEPLNSKIPNARRLARKFTPQTPFHHPHLDPTLPPNDLQLVPAALFPGRKLNWELPRPAVTNLHVKLHLTNDHDELQKEFRDKIPQINEVLGLWGELKEASPTKTGEVQLRARTLIAKDQDLTSTEKGEGNIFNLVSTLDTPGRADVMYLTDAVEDSEELTEDSIVPSNLRTIEWLGFDGSYIHLEDAEATRAPFPTEHGCDFALSTAPSPILILETFQSRQDPTKTFGCTTIHTGPNWRCIAMRTNPVTAYHSKHGHKAWIWYQKFPTNELPSL